MVKKKTRKEELIDELLDECNDPESFLSEEGPMKLLHKRFYEKALEAEMDFHLGYSKHARTAEKSAKNNRNGSGSKVLYTGTGGIKIATPRDRNGTFLPQIVPKREKNASGFKEKIIALYARGMSVRDIQSNLEEIYSVDVSEGFISTVTDSVIEDVRLWQSRPLDAFYPIVFLDGIRVKSREDGRVQNKVVYLALGINMEGEKELLGMWIAKNEGAKFWLSVVTELKNRGVEDIFIACVDGLKGFPEAINSVYPQAQVQLCIVHMIRNSVRYVAHKDRKELCADLKSIYTASTADEAKIALDNFAQKWDCTYPSVSKIWQTHWDNVTAFFQYPADIRKVIYTTNVIESLNRSLRKVLKTKGAFPNDESIFKIMYLALDKISQKWTMPISNWKAALNQFAIQFEGRFSQ